MTRERDRWEARWVGARYHPTTKKFILIQRLEKDWDRFVETTLHPDEVRELMESFGNFLNDIAEQSTNEVA